MEFKMIGNLIENSQISCEKGLSVGAARVRFKLWAGHMAFSSHLHLVEAHEKISVCVVCEIYNKSIK